MVILFGDSFSSCDRSFRYSVWVAFFGMAAVGGLAFYPSRII